MDIPFDGFSGFTIEDAAPFDPGDEVRKATVFALANGYMSARGAPESAPLDVPGIVGHHVNGLYDMPGDDILAREMINLPAWTLLRLHANGQELTLTGAVPVDYTRALDMQRGILRQRARWRLPGGPAITLDSERLVSMARPHLGLIRWQLSSDADCAVTIESTLDARVTNRFAATHFAQVETDTIGTGGVVTVTTIERGDRVEVMAAHHLGGVEPAFPRSDAFADHVTTAWTFDLRAGQHVTLDKYVAVYDSYFSAGDLDVLCRTAIEAAQDAGYAALREEHAARWADLWAESDVRIEGDEPAQVALRFCLFHLLANRPHSERVSVSARGLQGQDYWGSIFWDNEIYVLPFFIYTQPGAARHSLLYRYHTLDGARRKARSLGFRGAYYAWQSQDTGDETCALYVFDDPRTGEKIRSYFADEQIHISADIAFAVWQYVRATGDDGFLAHYGLEILCEVARFYVSRSVENPATGLYALHSVLGPDEYHERVNNNAYTNAMARLSLGLALDALARVEQTQPASAARLRQRIALDDAELSEWRQARARFYVPQPDPASGVIAQFDGYFDLEDVPPDVARARLAHPDLYPGGPLGPFQGTQAIKQADVVLLMYLLRDRYDRATKRANWDYYEPRTAHDSSLSPVAYALVAADVGLLDWAYEYFMRTAMLDLSGTGPHWNLGVHTAAMGGAWLAVVHGFCQLNLREDGIHLLDWPRLPVHWSRVAFNLRWHGHRVRFTSGDSHTTFSAESGPVPVHLPDGTVVLEAGETKTSVHSTT